MDISGRNSSTPSRVTRSGQDSQAGGRGTKKGSGSEAHRSIVAPPRTPAVTYSPTLPGSTIGAGGLNGSVRYG